MALFDTITIAGGGKTYTFSGIEVNDEEDLKVKVDGTSLNLNTPADYTISGSQITFSSTYAVTDGDKYVIYRDTKDDAARNQFYPSGSVRAQDLNKNFEQCLMAAEDKVPLFGAVMPDDINMGGNSITNLKDEYTSSTDPNAADADDAASHGWVRKFFFDVKAETRTGAEYDSEPPATKWPNDDLTVATTSAVNKFIDDKNDASSVFCIFKI